MKKYILFLFLLLCYYCLAQETNANANLRATYNLQFKKFVDTDKTSVEQMILFVKKDASSIFLNHKMLLRDSIQQVRKTDVNDVASLFCFNNYIIQQSGIESKHSEELGGDLITFTQNIVLDWQLKNESMIISQYNCKKATVNYGGRDWVAWYAIDIPSSFGPYIFKGLPGLILEISDLDNVFHFTIESLQNGSFTLNTDVENYFYKKTSPTINTMSSVEFFKGRNNYNKLSLDERIKYINRSSPENAGPMSLTSSQGENLSTSRPSKVRNFIERVE